MLQPIKSEKSLKAASVNKYTFKTEVRFTKPEIKRSIEKLFGVKVTKIQTAIFLGKSYRAGRKGGRAMRPDWKKAIVSVAQGQKIDIYGT